MPLKIHHFNAGTLCPACARLVHGYGGFFEKSVLVCHCLLIEASNKLVLVDTGLGLGDVENPNRLGKFFLFAMRPKLQKSETAFEQVKALGFQPTDVTDILLTHLDLDHAGGINDFENATVHVHINEHQNAVKTKHPRYVSAQWSANTKWQLQKNFGEDWFGFQGVKPFDEALPEVLVVPLPGHSYGHCGVAIKDGNGWLMHTGDAFFHHNEIIGDGKNVPFLLKVFQSLVNDDRAARLHNLNRLRHLADTHQSEIKIINSHDPYY